MARAQLQLSCTTMKEREMHGQGLDGQGNDNYDNRESKNPLSSPCLLPLFLLSWWTVRVCRRGVAYRTKWLFFSSYNRTYRNCSYNRSHFLSRWLPERFLSPFFSEFLPPTATWQRKKEMKGVSGALARASCKSFCLPPFPMLYQCVERLKE